MKPTPLPWYWQYDQPDQSVVVGGSGTIISAEAHVGHIHRGVDGLHIIRCATVVDELAKAAKDLLDTVTWLSDSGNMKSPIEPHPYGLAVIQAKQNVRNALYKLKETDEKNRPVTEEAGAVRPGS